MQYQRFYRRAAWLITAASLVAMLLSAAPAGATPFDGLRGFFADQSFYYTWGRTDVETMRDGVTPVRGNRTYYWGPKPWYDYNEFYRQGINGLRLVQYFDKARMEINNTNDRSFQGGVTNGLLVVELVSGQLKRGNDPTDNDYRTPAEVPVAGNPRSDNPNAPSYARFSGVATINNNNFRDLNRLGQRVSAFLDNGGNVSVREDLAFPETEVVQYNTVTGHNIPRVFWEFMNARGRVSEGAGLNIKTETIIDWTFAMGLPISDAYWTRAKIGAQEQHVLVQLFERRVLTYTPANPAGYQVEMGNVGQHYFQWRYPQLGTPWTAPDANPPLLFATTAINDVFQIAQWQFGANSWIELTGEATESVAYSYRRSYEPSQTRILFDSRQGNGTNRQIYELDAPTIYAPGSNQPRVVRRLTFSDGATPGPEGGSYWYGNPSNDYNPSASPDGTKIAFVSDREGAPELYLMASTGSYAARLTTDNCVSQVPSWSPDGKVLFWERKCGDGKFALLRGELAYVEDSLGYLGASLTNIQVLTDQTSDNRFPRISPDGRTLAFTSYRDGNAEIYLMDPNGSNLRRLTNSPAEDEAASWRADGQQLAFASNRDGNYKVYVVNRDGSGLARVSNTAGDDRWVVWAQ